MRELTREQQIDMRAYWLVRHGEGNERAILSGAATLGDLHQAMLTFRGVDPKKARKEKQAAQEALLRRIARHSGVDVEKIKGGMD